MPRSPLHPPARRRGTAAAAAVLAAAACSLPLRAAAAPAESAAAAAAIVEKAASEWRGDVSGIMAFKAMTVSDINGGPIHHHEEQTVGYVERDGVVTHKRVISDVKDGYPLSQGDIDGKSAAHEDSISRTGLKLPYKPDAVGDYQYSLVSARDGVQTVHFQSKVRDESHGDGDLSIDDMGRITHVSVQLAAVKRPATSGLLVISFGDVMGQTRGVTTIARHFTGRAFFITGHGDEMSTYRSYERFASEHDAVAALSAMTAQ